MSPPIPGLDRMARALQLVRAGQLKEAVHEIQQRLHARAEPMPVEEPPSPAAPPPAPGERFETHTFTNHAGTRQYKLYVPAEAGDGPMPLVVMLHGCTQSPDDFAAGTRMNALGARHGFLVAYPAQASAANPNRCWNWFRREDQRRDHGEPSLIAGIVGAIKARHRVDDRRVFVAGLSSGGAMAATLGATYPELFAAVGVHSGLPHGAARDLPSGLAAMRSGAPGASVPAVPTIVFHGDRDTLVNPRNAEELVAQQMRGHPGLVLAADPPAEANGYAYTRRSARSASGQALVEHWIVHGAGHVWSGGSPQGSHTDARGPDASGEMLRFFLAAAAAP
ncbi:MAG TPA: PHB depolymerase family esterase [Usitatibacter sp.]|nr:PHB depolymerase family esterase [Usitatibacter sp.]